MINNSNYLKLKISLKAIAWFVAFFFFLMCLPTAMAWSNWIVLIALVAALLVSTIIFFVPKIFKYHLSRNTFFKLALASFFTIIVIIGFPLYYLTYVTLSKPVLVPQATLTDGDKTIVFQGMMHIGREEFYKSVVYDLENALSTGYKLYYEGVVPSNPTSDKWLRDYVTHGVDLSELYNNFANLCGLKFQLKYFEFLALEMKKHPESHLNADVTTAQMQSEYDRLMKTDTDFFKAVNEEKQSLAPDNMGIAQKFFEWEKNGSIDRQKAVGFVCRGLLTMVLNHPRASKPGQSKIILDFRNKNLVDTISKDKAKKIYITYGAEHLKGVMALLKERNPKWEMKSIKWSRVIGTPEHYQGEL